MTGSARVQVVAGLLVRDGRVLLCHRCADRQWYPDVWDLPGGHVEAGETLGSALVRELGEELAIVLEEPLVPETALITAPGVEMRIWRIDTWVGEPVNAAQTEHDDLAWFTPAEAKALSLAHESYPALIDGVLP
ncbi:MAG: NUDIX domain-containing protein [Acidimicrobiales bacterium]